MQKVFAISGLLCCAAGICRADDAPPAWVNAVDTNAMERVLFDYTNNVIRSEWAGKDISIGKELPANLGFQFAVVGDENVTNRVNAILQATRGSIPSETLKQIEAHNCLGPTLQWLVRSTRQGVTNSISYLEVNARTAVFEEADFNLDALTNMASRLYPQNIPPVVAIQPVFKVVPQFASMLPAEPGIDYPDIMPEQTFSCKYGVGIVLRAPEAERCFRFMVQNRLPNLECQWRSMPYSPILSYRYNHNLSPVNGFAEIRVAADRQFRRIDVMVCQGCGGVFGPPTFISFYSIPQIKRTYGSNKEVISVEYGVTTAIQPPYDISPIWIPREWCDEYEYRSGEIQIITRSVCSSFQQLPRSSAEEFSGRGEQVLEKDYSNNPRTVRKVRYYVDGGELKYEPCGEEIRVRGLNPRKRGEDGRGCTR